MFISKKELSTLKADIKLLSQAIGLSSSIFNKHTADLKALEHKLSSLNGKVEQNVTHIKELNEDFEDIEMFTEAIDSDLDRVADQMNANSEGTLRLIGYLGLDYEEGEDGVTFHKQKKNAKIR